jgi:hypothetical protein
LQRLWSRTLAWWDDLGPHQRRTVNALSLCIVGFIAHYLVFTVSQPFYIEDAGISFAYARNLIEGHGLVTFPGGERVEGYSNPTWTFLMALFMVVKVSPWISSKIMGAVLGAITLPLVWAITRRARGGIDDLINIVPAFLLAGSTQFVLWCGAGLENSVFCVLLAAGLYRTVREGVDGGRPWSPFLWFLLAITRPEGAMYGALGLFAFVVFRIHRAITQAEGSAGQRVLRGVVLPVLTWVAIFGIPLALYHWWRYSYFAWEYPATYYAKLGDTKRFRPFSWDIRGWGYAKKYMVAYWIAWVTPLFFFATAGLERRAKRFPWRSTLGLVLLAIFGLVVIWDGKGGPFDSWDFWTPMRRKWIVIRCWSIYGGAIMLGLLTLGRKGWQALSITWAAYCAAMFFNLYVGGDWMDGFRWASMWVVPQSILLALGLGALVDRIPGMAWRPCRLSPKLRTLLLAAAAIAIASPAVMGSYDFVTRPETGVRDVNRRVQYMTWVQERLHIDHITLLDVDMGAHMWFSGWRIMDVAGLVDVRMGHHNYQKEFMREYVFQEERPDFIHSHGGWSRKTKINNFPEFKRGWIEIPGYPAGRKAFHMGNHVARRHLATETWDGPDQDPVPFEGGITLSAVSLRSAEVPVEGKFHLQTWWQAPDREDGFRILIVLADGQGRTAVQEVGPGYDFLRVEDWRKDEWVYGRYDVVIPKDFPEGSYHLALVLLDEQTGLVLTPWPAEPTPGPNDPGFDPATAQPAPEGELATAAGPPLYMQGELLLEHTVLVVSRKQATAEATKDLELAQHLAAQGECETAWDAWGDAKRHVIRNTRWHNQNLPTVNAAMTRCFVDRAGHEDDRFEQAELYETAALYRYDQPELLAVARPLAAALMDEGEAFRQTKDWESCYRYFDTAVRVDPRLSLARRRAEECRDWRLDIDGVDHPKEKTKTKLTKKKPSKKKANDDDDEEGKSKGKGKGKDDDEGKTDDEAGDDPTEPASPRAGKQHIEKVELDPDAPSRALPFRPGPPGAIPGRLDPTLGPAAAEQGEPPGGPEAGMKRSEPEPEGQEPEGEE